MTTCGSPGQSGIEGLMAWLRSTTREYEIVLPFEAPVELDPQELAVTASAARPAAPRATRSNRWGMARAYDSECQTSSCVASSLSCAARVVRNRCSGTLV